MRLHAKYFNPLIYGWDGIFRLSKQAWYVDVNAGNIADQAKISKKFFGKNYSFEQSSVKWRMKVFGHKVGNSLINRFSWVKRGKLKHLV